MSRLSIARLPAASINDYGVFADLHAKAFCEQDDKPWSADAFRQLVESPGMEIWLASTEGRPAGYILTRRIFDEAELISIGVDPELQQAGCGSRMLRTALMHLAEHGVETLFLEVRADNITAQNFYQHHGFVPNGTRNEYYKTMSGKRVDALCFALSVKRKKTQDQFK